MTIAGESSAHSTTKALIEEVRTLRFEDIAPAALTVARHCILDFLGCALAGSNDPLVDMLAGETVAREHATEASLIGRRERGTAASVALVTGAAAHALDYDDTHTTMLGHPTVPVLPAVLALAEAEGASGRRVMEAFVAGFQLECRLGSLLGPAHYMAGFHATATIGTFGAAAAAARLLILDEARWMHAIGLAGTSAAGLKVSFGTMAKPLHAGRAASTGVMAALLARRGFTAADSIIEAPQGFATTHGGLSGSDDWRRGDRDFLCETLFKYHAACYLTHAAIEAATELRIAHTLDTASIRDVEVRVAPAALGVCNIAEPATGLEMKFSLRATTAMALLGDDTASPDAFTDAHATASRLCELRDRVRVVADESLAPTASIVTVAAGASDLRAEKNTGVPAADLALQGRRLEQKFRALASPVLGATRSNDVIGLVAQIGDLPDITGLVAALR